MSWVDMQVVTVNPNSPDRVFAYEIDRNTVEASNDAWIMVPEGVNSVSVTISFKDGGRGKVQTTTDRVLNVKNDVNIIAVDWDLGVVTDTIQDSVMPVTAFRLVQTSDTGSCKLTARAQ